MTTTAEQAIARSISHNEIVAIAYDAETLDALYAECEGSVDAGDHLEFWGTSVSNPAGEWRVHMSAGQAYRILEAGYEFLTVIAPSAAQALELALEQTAIRASDYNCEVGDEVQIDWYAHPVGSDYGPGQGSDRLVTTVTAE